MILRFGGFYDSKNCINSRRLRHHTLLTQYCAGDKIEKNEMGWACGAYG